MKAKDFKVGDKVIINWHPEDPKETGIVVSVSDIRISVSVPSEKKEYRFYQNEISKLEKK